MVATVKSFETNVKEAEQARKRTFKDGGALLLRIYLSAVSKKLMGYNKISQCLVQEKRAYLKSTLTRPASARAAGLIDSRIL